MCLIIITPHERYAKRYRGLFGLSFMVVKSIRGRRRYVVYSITKTITRNDILNVLSEYQQRTMAKVILCCDGKAIVRCSPNEVALITNIMVSKFNECTSIVTSGTLRTIYGLYPYLKTKKK